MTWDDAVLYQIQRESGYLALRGGVAWLLKTVILRYGGRPGFQRAVPFFLGLIRGPFVVGSLWNIYGILMEVPTYQFLQ